MEDNDHKADTAGNVKPQAENVSNNSLLPVIAPKLISAPEKIPETPPVLTVVVPKKKIASTSPRTTPLIGNIDELIRTAQATALGKSRRVASVAKTPASDTPTLPPEPPPIERSVREIGLAQQPIRPATPPEESLLTNKDLPKGVNPRIRTYALDMSDEIRKRRTTLSSIVGAEQDRNVRIGPDETETRTVPKSRLILFIVAALILVTIGGGAITAAVLFKKPIDISAPRSTLIPTNRYELVEILQNASLSKVLATVKKSAALDLGNVEELIVTKDGRTPSAEELLLMLGAPAVLARNATNVMIGVHSFDRNQPFILITVSSYDLAFDAMLAWEQRMNEGLGDFFQPNSLTPSGIVSAPPELIFTDRVFQNSDLRESQLSWQIIYSFLRPNLILITTNESTFREITTRLSLQKS